MTVFEKTDRFLRNLYETAFYFAVMAVKENFRNYVGRAGTVGAPKPSVVILGNGPSLAEDLPRLIARGEHTAKDVMAVNYFALDERFTTVRPAYYVLSDPMFFRDSVCRDRVAELYRMLAEKVTWPMNLYVQYYNPERFDYRAALPNPNIRIVRFHTQVYRGFRGVEFWLYRHGLGSANFGTVVQVCEYVALLLGYKTLELYGVDHTLLDGLSVDDENRLCRADRHYYDDAPAVPKPIFQKVPHRPYTMAVYLAEVAELFRGHEALRDYARSLGARIINRTEGSMIDAYERERKLKKGGFENSQGRKTHFSAIRLCFQAAARGGLLWSVRNSRLPQGGAAACRFASGKSKIFRACEFAGSAFIYPGRFRLAAMISAMAKSSG